ncbi:anti-sigma factor domain-containing protein [Thalassobacillus sp. CUG 92003]|uniref:anti-sigma factor n=1 Tax=Thalassobacillus sp. CUG 92003 TaxID=2736641 RepID=UPI0015E72A89|nr:anti-sigma factor [Thalassobacillus sp. CUG 92003]
MYKECEKVIDYFNGHLTEQEAQAFEAHLETCEDCQEELRELRELTEHLPLASEPVEPPAEMKQNVLDAAFTAGETTDEEPEANEDKSSSSVDRYKEKQAEKRKLDKPAWLMPVLAAGLIFSLMGNMYAVFQTTQSDEDEAPPVESTDEVLQRVQLQGEGTNANATAAMINQGTEDMLVVQAGSLDPLQGDEVYQVWLINDDQPYRAGSFKSNQQGEGAVAYSMAQLQSEGDWDAIAISKEPNANSETPQGEVMMSSEL